jgi:hypothetical protein
MRKSGNFEAPRAGRRRGESGNRKGESENGIHTLKREIQRAGQTARKRKRGNLATPRACFLLRV